MGCRGGIEWRGGGRTQSGVRSQGGEERILEGLGGEKQCSVGGSSCTVGKGVEEGQRDRFVVDAKGAVPGEEGRAG